MKNTVHIIKYSGIVILFLLFSHWAEAEKLADLPQLARPEQILMKDNRLYVLDGIHVYIYTMENFKLAKKLGKKGHGPGEMIQNEEVHARMVLVDNGVFISNPLKSVTLDLEGKVIHEKRSPFFMMQSFPFHDKIAVTRFVHDEVEDTNRVKTLLVDKNLENPMELCSYDHPNSFSRGRIYVPFTTIIMRNYGGKLYTHFRLNSSRIQVWDSQGKRIQVIEPPIPSIKLTPVHKTKIMQWFERSPRTKEMPTAVFERIKKLFVFHKTFPKIRNYHVEQDRIYIRTNQSKDNTHQFLVLNLKGKLLKEMYLPEGDNEIISIGSTKLYCFRGNTYYYITENEDSEMWELHKLDI